jgi:hypothetical protein
MMHARRIFGVDLDARGTSFIKRRLFQMISSLDNVLPLGLKSQQVK